MHTLIFLTAIMLAGPSGAPARDDDDARARRGRHTNARRYRAANYERSVDVGGVKADVIYASRFVEGPDDLQISGTLSVALPSGSLEVRPVAAQEMTCSMESGSKATCAISLALPNRCLRNVPFEVDIRAENTETRLTVDYPCFLAHEPSIDREISDGVASAMINVEGWDALPDQPASAVEIVRGSDDRLRTTLEAFLNERPWVYAADPLGGSYVQRSVETWMFAGGDCEDLAIALGAFLADRGYNWGLVEGPTHVIALIRQSSTKVTPIDATVLVGSHEVDHALEAGADFMSGKDGVFYRTIAFAKK